MKLIILPLLLLPLAYSQSYNYAEVISKSLLFYEAQRTGRLPGGNRIPWRGDSFLNDRGQDGEDLTGGYFDAGDFVKFGFPFASAMSMLGWGMVEFKDGYVKAGEWERAKEALRWGMDYMTKAHPSPNVLYVQVGDGNIDHSYWGRPEDWADSRSRPYLRATTAKPASEVAGEQAAAMAAASEVFGRDGETEYAATLLRHARELYTFATTYRQKYSDSFPEVKEFYDSYSGYGDEFLWAAAWLYRVTKEGHFQQDYERWWTEFSLDWRPTEASWDFKLAQAQSLLAKVDGSGKYVNAVTRFCDWLVGEAPRSTKGLAFLSQWGSLRHVSNAGLVCLTAAEGGVVGEEKARGWREFVRGQMGYILGDTGRSFVCGYGVNPPLRPHHASSSCPNRPAPCDWSDFSSPNPNPQVLNGALVGGPDNLQDMYEDKRDDYVMNEVTIDYNAGFQGVIAGLCRVHC